MYHRNLESTQQTNPMKAKIPYQLKLMLATSSPSPAFARLTSQGRRPCGNTTTCILTFRSGRRLPFRVLPVEYFHRQHLSDISDRYNDETSLVGTPMLSLWAGADTVDNQEMAASMGVEFMPFATRHGMRFCRASPLNQ